MAKPELVLEGIKKPAAWEYVLRFMFGGAVTVCTGLVAKRYGPAVGGMFLAFPAILPASLTLVKRHDGTAERWPPVLSLAAATAVWLALAVALWAITYGRT